jgi:hypothetical protein
MHIVSLGSFNFTSLNKTSLSTQFSKTFPIYYNFYYNKLTFLNYLVHGTVKNLGKITKEDLDDINNSKEYALRPKYNDNCWKSLLKFRIDENSI